MDASSSPLPDTPSHNPEPLADAQAELANLKAANADLADQFLRAKAEVENAMQAGVFGSPHFIVDGEPFWGIDKFEQIDRWLATGGW